MRLSEAIQLGAMMTSQAFRTLFKGDGACALGAALLAVGVVPKQARGSVRKRWPWAFAVNVNCPSCGRSRLVCETIVHLNDDHRWTREEIGTWVAAIEPSQPPENPRGLTSHSSEPKNLWPERWGTPGTPLTSRGPFSPHLVGARAKDVVEGHVNEGVCSRTLTPRGRADHRYRLVSVLPRSRLVVGMDRDDPSRPGGAPPMMKSELIGEVAECLQEALQLQSRVTEVTERAHQAAGMSVADRALRGKVTGLFFGLLAHLEELNRLVREET